MVRYNILKVLYIINSVADSTVCILKLEREGNRAGKGREGYKQEFERRSGGGGRVWVVITTEHSSSLL